MIPYPDRLVIVEWEDAWTTDNWVEEVSRGPVIVWTVGYVVVEDEEGITLAQAITEGGFGNLWRVPNGMIRRVNALTVGEPA